MPTSSPTGAATQAAPVTSLPTLTRTSQNGSMTRTPGTAVRSAAISNATVINVMIGIIALALVGGGIFTWLGSSRKK